MKKLQLITPVAIAVAALLSSGCSTTQEPNRLQTELDDRQAMLNSQAMTLKEKEANLSQKEMDLSQKEAFLKEKEQKVQELGKVSAKPVLRTVAS